MRLRGVMRRADKHSEISERDVKRIVVINGSPHKEIGNTAWMLKWLLEPVKQRGWDIEVFHLADCTIDLCGGCGQCFHTQECPHSDDHNWIMKQLAQADGMIIGGPSYFMSVTAQMKVFIDRCTPYVDIGFLQGKYAMTVSPGAGTGGQQTAAYLGYVCEVMGATVIDTLSSVGTWPGVVADKLAKKQALKDAGEVFCQTILQGKLVTNERPKPQWKENMKIYKRSRNLPLG